MWGALVYTVSCSLLSAPPSIMILNSYAAERTHARERTRVHQERPHDS